MDRWLLRSQSGPTFTCKVHLRGAVVTHGVRLVHSDWDGQEMSRVLEKKMKNAWGEEPLKGVIFLLQFAWRLKVLKGSVECMSQTITRMSLTMFISAWDCQRQVGCFEDLSLKKMSRYSLLFNIFNYRDGSCSSWHALNIPTSSRLPQAIFWCQNGQYCKKGLVHGGSVSLSRMEAVPAFACR